MTPDAVASATASVVSGLASHFMTDPATYVLGADLGFDGIDFYIAGRGGALGDVAGDVVASALVFFSPATVIEGWDRARSVMAPHDAARHFIGAGHDWADAHLTNDADLGRLADLLGTMIRGASPAGAPLFAAWRTQAEPGADRPRALVLHRLNVVRELRGALHGAAVLAHGLSPHQAVSIRQPSMLGLFGWGAPHPDAERATEHSEWVASEAATDRALAPAYATLTEDQRHELCDLLATLDSTRTA